VPPEGGDPVNILNKLPDAQHRRWARGQWPPTGYGKPSGKYEANVQRRHRAGPARA
jgi:hypothetical protein